MNRMKLGIALTVLVGTAFAGLILADAARLEAYYAQALGPVITVTLGTLSGVVAFSIAEVLILATPLAIFAWLACVIWSLVVDDGRRIQNLAANARQLVVLCLVVGVAFYATWGFNYARPSLPDRLGWEASSVANATTSFEHLAMIASALVDATNDQYLRLHGTADSGALTDWRQVSADATTEADPADDGPATKSAEWALIAKAGISAPDDGRSGALRELDSALDVGLERAGARLGLEPRFRMARGPAKPVASSEVMNRLQLAGFYFPWTGEANFNPAMPAWQQPHTIAHEKAHQRGIASEDEANFVGFAGALLSDHAHARYSALLFAQRQLLRELLGRDGEFAQAMLERRLPGVQRDVDSANAFWRAYDGRLADTQRDFNDQYLRANGVESGVASYAESVLLILRWAKAEGGLPLDAD